MKNFPYYPQHDTMDCGPTCLRMVAAFHGKCYSLERLREKLWHEYGCFDFDFVSLDCIVTESWHNMRVV